MREAEIQAALGDLPLGGLRFFERIGSTNDEAATWASAGARDFSVVIADEQTIGRGRSGSRWFTPAGTALALSLILRRPHTEAAHAGRFSGLGALAVVDVCELCGVESAIKWPNDVLIGGRKVAGILVESVWLGNELDASIVGIGVNVQAGAVPPPESLAYPATSLETEAGRPINRIALLRKLLESLQRWRELMDQDQFIRAWEERLAFRGREVALGDGHGTVLAGKLLGLHADGSARLDSNHRIVTVHAGEMSLRPADDRMG